MIEKYYKFQVDRFFEDYRDNQKKLARLKEEREAELTSFSMDYSLERVTNSNISDPTEQRAFKRAMFDERIKELESYFSEYEYITSQLDDTEKLLVKNVLSVRGSGNKAAGINRVKNALFCETATVYRQVAKLREKVAEIVD